MVAPIVAGSHLVVAAGAGSMPLGGGHTEFEPEELASATHYSPADVASIAAAAFVVLVSATSVGFSAAVI